MKQHRYRITVEHLADKDGQPPATPASLTFEALNHDDIIAIAERMKGRGDFDAQTATNLAIGLKLFSEVMLMNRQHPLFAELGPHFGDFMKRLKSGPAQG
ncbi:DUF3861 domain-containing protein [Aquabacterium sp.]|uniref:DUF3861 domain-containing protein n=1 Tax=Aquabacterium sp. TaxID=1872578 RepID=UPI0025BEA522|nr:DUF3861 domain-containing protein [Aquabacterium sp.]